MILPTEEATKARINQGERTKEKILRLLELFPKGLTPNEIVRKSGLEFGQVHGCIYKKLPDFIKTEWEVIPNREHQLRRRISLK